MEIIRKQKQTEIAASQLERKKAYVVTDSNVTGAEQGDILIRLDKYTGAVINCTKDIVIPNDQLHKIKVVRTFDIAQINFYIDNDEAPLQEK